MQIEFSCEECGSSAVNLPKELADNALVLCHRCEKALCTWADFKEQTREVLRQLRREGDCDPVLSCDPL